MTLPAIATTTEMTAASFDAETLSRLNGMVRQTEIPVQAGPDVLKVNYDSDSDYECGTWVIGQKKDDSGAISEQGQPVNKVIILTTRWRYSYYDDKNKKAYNTQMFETGTVPRDKAEFDRKIASLGAKYGQRQLCVFALAIVGGAMKECVIYIKGVSRGTFEPYFKELVTFNTGSGTTLIPPFCFVTELLPSEKKKNGSITYWVPNFKKGAQVPVEQFDNMKKKQQEADAYVDFSNGRAEEASAGRMGTAAPALSAPATYAPAAPALPAAPSAPPTPEIMPWETAAPATPAAPAAPATPAAPSQPADVFLPQDNTAEPAAAGDTFDFDTAIRNIMSDN